MLGPRIVTALVLLALLLPALFAATAWPFAAVTLALIAAAGWEWGRLNQVGGAGAWLSAALVAAAGAAAWGLGWAEQAPAAVWYAAVAVWVLGGSVALRGGPALWPRLPRGLRWGLGLLALWAGWLAVVHARWIGVGFVLSVFCVVWMADIAAYFGGRAFGRRKLAPSISPGKSWEGVWSGMAGVWLLGACWWFAERGADGAGSSVFSGLHALYGAGGAALALVLLAGMSVVGDLVESLVKRAAGAKDSSGLLPGHGGVLDRIDALLPVFPLALALTAR